ncbi:hypothetical protein PoB_002840200 [Plakobranchus ocellatus]|uniref:Uncharacterized protein n=1 Tax=Plakobranchus ocellatus TaxID=259542 RepID=A0AAV4A3K7_9GAST|nr:hypothetical protein PoB_002840200 [Plakobranchus ocellatus]
MEAKSCQIYYIRNIEDGQTVPLVGEGEFTIGLTLNERIACSPSAQHKPGPTTLDDSGAAIVVPLMVVTIWRTAGVTVAPASKDLRCQLNGQDIGMEANLIPGNQVEVADKQLELLDEEPPALPIRPTALASAGASLTSSPSDPSSASPSPSSTPTPGGQTARRQLPPTPGVPILPVPPRKPQRVYNKRLSADAAGLPAKLGSSPGEAAPQTVRDVAKDALREWCRSELPNSEIELLEQTKNPDQLASLASSYLGRHLNLYTGVVMTADLTDRIFRVMLEVAHHRRDILRHFLSDVIDEFITDNEHAKENRDKLQKSPNDCEGDHATVMGLLVEILRQFLDPQFLVLLCLQLLRALSHIPGSVLTMVESHTATAVLGSMAVYREDSSIQSFCLDILAKVATYVPTVLEKPPLKESSIDLVMMALTLHYKKLPIAQAGIRTLANLACSLHSLSFAAMKERAYPELVDFVTHVVSIMVYLYETTSAMVRQCLGFFSDDLTIKMDGRRFLFESTKMDQLKQQQKLWAAQSLKVKDNHSNSQNSKSVADNQHQSTDCSPEPETGDQESKLNVPFENDVDVDKIAGSQDVAGEEENTSYGILKKSRSYENLRTPDRRVSFINEDDVPTHSSGSSSSSSAATSPSQELGNPDGGGSNSPDIQVLSRSIITPGHLSLGDSTDGEVGPSQEDSITESQQNPSLSYVVLGPAPPKPARRPIGAPLVHINSHSTDTDETPESPPPPPLPERTFKSNTVIASDSHNGDSEDGKELQTQVCHNSEQPSERVHSPSTNNSSSSALSVDLTNFRYTAADIVFMKRLLCVQVTCQVCAASARGQHPHALKLIDMPLHVLLSQADCPRCLAQFFRSQYTQDTKLMDVDPSAVISVIDAVRYEVLVFDLVRRSLEMLIQGLSAKLNTLMFAAVLEVITGVRQSPDLAKVFTDKEFLQQMRAVSADVKQTLQDRPEAISRMDALTQAFSDSIKEGKNLTNTAHNKFVPS